LGGVNLVVWWVWEGVLHLHLRGVIVGVDLSIVCGRQGSLCIMIRGGVNDKWMRVIFVCCWLGIMFGLWI
jgi:hypothetical protein